MPFLLTAAFPCLDDFVLFGVLTVNYTIKIKRIQKKKQEEKNRARPNAEDRTRRWDLSQSWIMDIIMRDYFIQGKMFSFPVRL